MTKIGSAHAHEQAYKHMLAEHKKRQANTELGKHAHVSHQEHISNKDRQMNHMPEHKYTNSKTNIHMTDGMSPKKKGKMGGRTKNQKKKSPHQHPEVQKEVLTEMLRKDGMEYDSDIA
jgi:hypothetical protein